MVALLTSVRNSPCFGGLRRTKTCHWQLFARPSVLFGYFLHDAKSNNPFSLAGRFEVLQTSNQRAQTTTSHNPIKSFFRLAAVSLPGRHPPCAFSPPSAAVPGGITAFITFLPESFAPFGAAQNDRAARHSPAIWSFCANMVGTSSLQTSEKSV